MTPTALDAARDLVARHAQRAGDQKIKTSRLGALRRKLINASALTVSIRHMRAARAGLLTRDKAMKLGEGD